LQARRTDEPGGVPRRAGQHDLVEDFIVDAPLRAAGVTDATPLNLRDHPFGECLALRRIPLAEIDDDLVDDDAVEDADARLLRKGLGEALCQTAMALDHRGDAIAAIIIITAAGRENLGRVMGTLGVPTVLAPVVGPTLGGWLLEAFSWRAIFLINLPIGILAFVLALRMLPKDSGQPTYRLDVLGLVLGSVGMATLTFAFSTRRPQLTPLRRLVIVLDLMLSTPSLYVPVNGVLLAAQVPLPLV